MHEPTLEPESAALLVGTVLGGRYRVLGVLGRGGMGVVYRAQHIALEREVALKTLHAGMLRDPSAAPRIIREARAAAIIEHPGIAHVFDVDTDNGITFLAMERLQGQDLCRRIASDEVLAVGRVAQLGVEICDAIAAAHMRGVLHRDLTPRNVFLAIDALGLERVKILDFGVAKLIGPPRDEATAQSERVFGTLAYMAPERLSGETDAADQRSDIYAIGVILYEALVGSPAFQAPNSAELAMRVAFERPVSLPTRRPDVPAALAAIIERAMQHEPEHRWSSAAEMADALRATLPHLADGSGKHAMSNAETATAPRPARQRARSRTRFLTPVVLGAAVLLTAAALWHAARKPTSATTQPIAPRAPASHEAAAVTAAPAAVEAPAEPEVQPQPPAPGTTDDVAVAPAPRAPKRPKAAAPRPIAPEEELPPLLPR